MMEGDLWMVLTTVFSIGVLMILWRRSTQQHHWPPGPRKLPIIGNLHQLNQGGELVHVNLAKMAQKYGGIMTVWFGSKHPTIVLSHHEVVWEVLVTRASDFFSRTSPYIFKITSANCSTLATCDLGPFWQNLRKGLQTFTFNPNTITSQTHLHEKEMADMILSLEEEASQNNGVVKPQPHLRRLIIRVMRRFCFGAVVPEEEQLFVEKLDKLVEEAITLSGHGRLVDVFEFTKYIPGLKIPFQELRILKHKITNLISPYVSAHKSSKFPPLNCHLNFLVSQDFAEDVVVSNLFELFLLAVDSTTAIIAWALTFMVHDAEIQQKLWEELRTAATVSTEAGSSGKKVNIISAEEVSNGGLEYLHAVVKESIRMKPIAPLPLPSRAVRDTELKDGTKVPKGTELLVNFYAVHHDPRVWKEPDRFMPQRFLNKRSSNETGSEALLWERDTSYFPFGAGRRICAGMDLAKLHVPLTLANIVNRFQMFPEVEGQLPDLSEELDFVLRMKTPLVARVRPRTS